MKFENVHMAGENEKENRLITVSVIMGVYNQPDRGILSDAVHSILNQTLTDLEFLIYDDGSHDGTSEYLLELSREDDRIILMGGEKNHGLAFSLNTCIREARGKYIARMDDDDISDQDRLEKQCCFLESHPEVSWCGCAARLIDDKRIWGVRRMPAFPQKTDYLKYSPYIHPTVMYRREVFHGGNGYRETGDMLRCEDYEIFMRLMESGLIGANLQEVLFSYREDENSYRRRSFHNRMNEAKLRFQNFSRMHILLPFGWLYVLRPVIGGLFPVVALKYIKHRQAEPYTLTPPKTRQTEHESFGKTEPVSEDPESE